MKRIFTLALTALLLTACSDSDDSKGSGENTAPTQNGGTQTSPSAPAATFPYIKWESIEEKYNPSTVEYAADFGDADTISLHVGGFDQDVRVIYTGEVRNIVRVVTYGVSDNETPWGGLFHVKEKNRLGIYNTSDMNCEIDLRKTYNAQWYIYDLKGRCYVRMEIFMPLDSKVKVYNAGVLLAPK